MLQTKDIDVVILCGGLGKRLRSLINDRPKPMVEINERPFLDILINYLRKFGFKHFILIVGYKANRIKKYYIQKKHLNIRFSEEKTLLGTGGAIKKARPLIRSKTFLVINGDSFCKVNLKKFLEFHNKKNALISIVLIKDKLNKECGWVKLHSSNRISNFNEKEESEKNGLVNAGIYLFQRQVFSRMPKSRKFFLEYDLFPKLIRQRFYGYLAKGVLIDIGTPQGLKRAKLYFKRFKF